MSDTQIHPIGTEAAPADFVIPPSAALLLKMVYASFDGSGAGSDFKPLLRIISDAGTVVGEAVADDVVAAGASADVSWFPRVGGGGGGTGAAGLQYHSGTYGADNEGDWFFGAVNDVLGGPNGYGWQFDSGSSDKPFAVTGDGGLVVDTAGTMSLGTGALTVDSQSEFTQPVLFDAGTNFLVQLIASGGIDNGGQQIVNGADGVNPTDFATVEQVVTAAGVSSVAKSGGTQITGDVTLSAGANVTLTEVGQDIQIAATGGGGGGGGAEIGYAEITAPVNITDTSEATATALISPGAIVFDGAAVLVTVYAIVSCPTAAVSNTLALTLFEGSTEIGQLAIVRSLSTATANLETVCAQLRFTPTAGSHTYKLCGFVSSVTGTPKIVAGAGGTGAQLPAFIRFTKV